WVPARSAGRRSPLEGLLAKRPLNQARFPRWVCLLGLGCIALTLLFEIALVHGWLTPAAGSALVAPSLAVGMVGCVLALPLVLPALARLVALGLRPLLGLEGSLAFRQLDRQPTRTALTAGVLFVGVAVSLGLGSSLLNNIRDIHKWYERTIVADFLVRGFMPDANFILTANLPEALGDELAALDGVERVDRIAFILGRARAADGTPQRLAILARTFAPDRPLRLDVAAGGDSAVVMDRLRQGEAVLGTVLAQRLGLNVADAVT